MSAGDRAGIDARIDAWRGYRFYHGESDAALEEQLESRLSEHVGSLVSAGLNPDEAFLVALKRLADEDGATREFAREFSAGLWAPLSPSTDAVSASGADGQTGFIAMLVCAVAAAAAIKLPELFGFGFDDASEGFYLTNISFFVLPLLAAFFAWTRRSAKRQLLVVAGVFVAGLVAANAYPFTEDGQTQLLTVVHLPILLWLSVGALFAGAVWRSVPGRMEFARFTGEWFITYVLIALGGGVLSAITIGVFEAIGMPAERVVSEWLIPCGAMAAVIVASWLVTARRSLVGGIAPMLARVFTPLFAAMLVVLVAAVMWTRGFVSVEREVLILFDVLLAVVLALLLYAISARDHRAAPGAFDRIQLVLLLSALVVDLFALTSMAVRLSQFGFSANKTAALGLNLILLVNLVRSAHLQAGFLRGKRRFEEIERWQMAYLPVYAIWAAVVAFLFPLVFGF